MSGRYETTTNSVQPGAGRVLSYAWPPVEFVAAGTQPPGSWLIRQAGYEIGVAQMRNLAVGAPPAPQGAVMYRGLQAYQSTGDGGPTGRLFDPITSAGAAYSFAFPIVRGADLGGVDDFACWRLAALMAFDDPAGAVPNDFGLTLCPGVNIAPRTDANAGMSLSVIDSQTVALTVVQADLGPATFQQSAAGVGDIRDWHLYEFRVIGATASAEAHVKVLVDGVTKFALAWGAGTVLPGLTPDGVQLGYHWTISNRGGAAFTTRLYVAAGGVSVAAAPSEAWLL